MTSTGIRQLVSGWSYPAGGEAPELIGTHISWVILAGDFAYKIKKPVQYSFLDFSTLEKRKFYCEKEVFLNRRFTHDIYLGVVTVRENNGRFVIGGEEGVICDYAVKMRKLDRDKQMDILLAKNKVSVADMENLAGKIALFHQNTTVVDNIASMDIREKFNDLGLQADFLKEHIKNSDTLIHHAIRVSDDFWKNNRSVFAGRLNKGYCRDCHGDLHSRNIFLLPEPTPFDCIEFNDEYRQIDVLNEIAFLCMDLDALGRTDLAELFLKRYDEKFHTLHSETDRQLFAYYKAYRANIRAKVNSLRARSIDNKTEREIPLAEAGRYLRLMDGYIRSLELESDPLPFDDRISGFT